MKKVLSLFLFISIFSSCSNDDTEINPPAFVPGIVNVGIESGSNINEVFNFVNQFEHSADNLKGITFISELPSDSLQYVKNILFERTYYDTSFNTVIWDNETNKIIIFPILLQIDNEEYQNDWLNLMELLELNQIHNFGGFQGNSGFFLFSVPEGEEVEWKNHFETFDIVDWADLKPISSCGCVL